MVNYLYGLHDPRTGELRYIGKTTKPLTRLKGHCDEARVIKCQCHRVWWIRALASDGLKPEFRLLDIVDGDGCEEERYLIKLARMADVRLVNGTDGGDGVLGYVPSASQRDNHSRKMRELLKDPVRRARQAEVARATHTGRKFSAAHKAKIGHAHRGMKHTEEFKRRLSESKKGKPLNLSPEQRAKISKRFSGPKTPEHLAKVGAANRGKPRPQHVRDAIRFASLGRKQSAESIAKRVDKLKASGHYERIAAQQRKLGGMTGELVALYAQGNTLAQIAARFGASAQTVMRYLKNAGTKMRTGGAGKGVKKPSGFGAKISSALKGRIRSPEHCAAISAAKLRAGRRRDQTLPLFTGG